MNQTHNKQDPVVIVGAKRTPLGTMLGSLSPVNCTELGATAIKGALEQSTIEVDQIDEVFMGCVLPAGLGQAPARQAALAAGIPNHVGATTINKMCGSGMKSIMLAHNRLLVEERLSIVAGGMESMSNAPYLLPDARQGYRLGHDRVIDHMFFDGLEDAYDRGKLMGVFADRTAEKFNISREQQDEFAITSVQRAQQASEQGLFADEIAPVTVRLKRSETIVEHDEGPSKVKLDKIPQLKPAFGPDGTVTAANASSIADGAAACVLMRKSTAEHYGLQPLAKIVAHASHAREPEWFTTAPVRAIEKCLAKAEWDINKVDLFEINEAFAVVTLVAMQQLDLPHEKVNARGGSCVLGHPIGATGSRIIVTLLNALQQRQQQKGVAALCIGGGEATAIAVEMCK